MFKFLKSLFARQKGKRTVVIFNDVGTEESSSYRFKPRNLWFLCTSLIITIIVLVIFAMIFTPLGGFVYNQQQMRESVITMQQQVTALRDSMHARNMQLQNLQHAVFSGQDSLFISDKSGTDTPLAATKASQQITPAYSMLKAVELPESAIAISNILEKPSQFPVEWPVDGTLTRSYNKETGHVGIDIAANKGANFHAIADGVVVGKNWSLNYGYVLYIQHSGGIITVYKHASEVVPEIGDLVLRSDILGRVGSTGIISSGPHLHMEIWANGVPQNPLHYLIKS